MTTLHGTDITIVGQDPSFQAITKFSIEKSDGLTAVSTFLQQETLTTFGCTACRIEVIPNFIDPDVYDRSRYTSVLDEQVDSSTRVLMHVSNFRPVKRIKDIIQVFARVSKKVPSVLVMVGDGPDRGDAELEARTLGVDDRVFFLGKIDTVAPLVGGRGPVPASLRQGIVRAQRARGAGVRRARDRYQRRWTSRGRSSRGDGIPVPMSATSKAMADAAIEFLSDNARWQAASTLAARDARERFSQAQIVAQYEDFYRYALALPSVIARKKRPHSVPHHRDHSASGSGEPGSLHRSTR